MNRRTLTLILTAAGLVVVVIAAAATALITTRTSAEQQPQLAPTAPVAGPTPVELSDNEYTALQAARIMSAWTPADDTTRTAAEKRATHLMTDDRAARVTAPKRPASGQAWRTAAEHHATSTPTVEINRATENTTISVIAHWIWTTPTGEKLPADNQQRIYYFHFNNHGQITDYTYEQTPLTPPEELD